MSTEDDWAPLPPDQLQMHPGELAARVAASSPAPVPLAPAATSPAEPKPAGLAAPAAAKCVQVPPDPEALRALAALQQRLAAAPAADDFVSAVLQRERRQQQKQRRAMAKATAAVAPVATAGPAAVVAPDAAAAIPAAPAVAPAAAAPAAPVDVDARELEPWFQELPEPEQQRLRRTWSAKRQRFGDEGAKRRRRLQRVVVYGLGLFGFLALLQAPLMGLGLVLPLAGAGALAAGVADLCGGGRFVFSFCGAIAFVAVQGPMVLVQPFGIMSLLIACYGLGTIGMDGEMRRSGGFGDA
ncbi:MAG: hypothetical protein IT455_14530 [Planctomycetes bacterium]|nr:hypothetical protein [Planctomycetota bacterium]